MEMLATKLARLCGWERKLHLCLEVNGEAGNSLCGRRAPWPWSINRPWPGGLGLALCTLCLRKEQS